MPTVSDALRLCSTNVNGNRAAAAWLKIIKRYRDSPECALLRASGAGRAPIARLAGALLTNTDVGKTVFVLAFKMP